jgi:AGCS family alanine or glycine:cation symporter
MVHSSAKTRHPVEQGLWGSFEVFFDTFIICSITALSVILSGQWTSGANGGTLALNAFDSSFGLLGSILLAVIMVIFTVTTSGGWFTYYLAILEHLYKREGPVKTVVMKLFYAVRALPGLLWTIYLVKTNNQGFIWTVVDITSAVPTFINVAVILTLSGQYFRLLQDYKARYLNEGTVDPSVRLFYEDPIPAAAETAAGAVPTAEAAE